MEYIVLKILIFVLVLLWSCCACYHILKRFRKPKDILADPNSVIHFLHDESLKDFTEITLDEIQKISLSRVLKMLRQSKEQHKVPKKSDQVGSDRWGKCNLHALDAKLSPLFSADICDCDQGRSSTRIIFHFKSDQLWFYGFLYNHEYSVLRCVHKLGNIEDEKGFLENYNKAKYFSKIINHRFNYFKKLIDNEKHLYTEDIEEFCNAHRDKLKEFCDGNS